MSDIDLANTRSILILHAGALGDFILMLNLITALRERLPQTAIDVAARCGLSRWAVAHGAFRRALSFESLGLHGLYSEGQPPAGLVATLQTYELVVSFLSGPDEPPAQRLSALPRGKCLSVDPRPHDRTLRERRHITEQWRTDLAKEGLSLAPAHTSGLTVGHDERCGARELLSARAGQPLVIVHPGSGGRDKCCPLLVLERVVEDLRLRGADPVWMLGPAEVERGGAPLQGRLASSARVIFEPDLPRAARVIAGADAYIGNDAGPTHLAAMLGVPTLALFGPTDPHVWRPLGQQVAIKRFNPRNEEMPARIRVAARALLNSDSG
ncbi:MAG TPA: glycosyltransferase family 9 protein [Phycisphaerae bacterium]